MSWLKLRRVNLDDGSVVELRLNSDSLESVTKTNARMGYGGARDLSRIITKTGEKIYVLETPEEVVE